MRPRHGLVHLLDHGLILMRASDREHARMDRADAVGLDAEAAGDDNAAILRQGFADRGERFLLGAVEEAASIHHHRIGALVAGRQLITL